MQYERISIENDHMYYRTRITKMRNNEQCQSSRAL